MKQLRAILMLSLLTSLCGCKSTHSHNGYDSGYPTGSPGMPLDSVPFSGNIAQGAAQSLSDTSANGWKFN